MSGEASGNIENLSEKSDVNFATASFGQGITATPIQIVQAIGAIANGGTIMKPYIVDKIVTPEKKGEVRSPQVVRQIIAPKTAHQLTAMMVSVIEKSVTHGAVIEGYDLAGKTGTAQMPDPEKGGYSEDVVHSFVGFGPASDPQFLIFIKIERPRGIRFAESTLSEPFRDLAEFILHYYEIPPE